MSEKIEPTCFNDNEPYRPTGDPDLVLDSLAFENDGTTDRGEVLWQDYVRRITEAHPILFQAMLFAPPEHIDTYERATQDDVIMSPPSSPPPLWDPADDTF